MLNDELKLVLDDARHRQAAMLQLIYFTDQQALGLLRLYITLGIAAATGAVAILAPGSWLPPSASLALAASALALQIGCYFCFRAMRTAEISLPGRGADFWKAALASECRLRDVMDQYLEDLEEGQGRDQLTNRQSAKALARAKLAGPAAAALALAVFIVSLAARWL